VAVGTQSPASYPEHFGTPDRPSTERCRLCGCSLTGSPFESRANSTVWRSIRGASSARSVSSIRSIVSRPCAASRARDDVGIGFDDG
jgi:hypothetical protein